MRSFLATALVATGATLAAVQFASAAATIPDYQARVNTASAVRQDPIRDATAVINAPARAQVNRMQFYEIPARR